MKEEVTTATIRKDPKENAIQAGHHKDWQQRYGMRVHEAEKCASVILPAIVYRCQAVKPINPCISIHGVSPGPSLYHLFHAPQTMMLSNQPVSVTHTVRRAIIIWHPQFPCPLSLHSSRAFPYKDTGTPTPHLPSAMIV